MSEKPQSKEEGPGSPGPPKQGEKRPHSDEDSESGSEVDIQGEEAKGGSSTEDMARLRREKRLAMNRESARARRMRKKVLLETLERQVADLAKRNQHYQAANEALTAKVHHLENELTSAKSTIALLTNQSRGIDSGDPLRRLLQGQPAPEPAVAGRDLLQSQILREELIRQRALEYQALSQAATRESALSRIGLLDQTGQAFPAGIHPTSIQNTAAMPTELAAKASARLPGSPLQVSDALAPGPHSSPSSDVISELLKQRAKAYQSPGYKP